MLDVIQVSQPLTIVVGESVIDNADALKGHGIPEIPFVEGGGPFILDFGSGVIRRDTKPFLIQAGCPIEKQFNDHVVGDPESDSSGELKRTGHIYNRSFEHNKHLKVWYTYAMFETSAIEEVQQENVVRENPKGSSNEQGAMIDDIGSDIENSQAATAHARSHLTQALKTQSANSSMVNT
ncbi:syntaxin/t-SNARE family protein [Artemisia annua]|uniref:Syntaxin/t-SNARE family protein n=1 Tax=Artemisia annua TaxID=35608 RepID=A0A2U1P1J8_ARTAN|nr:syntaxin/t-SNARE family protein [Artemisia annua]